MRYPGSTLLLALSVSLLTESDACTQSQTSKAKPNRARSGAYARHDR
jgi:hypothetical protein